MNQNPSGVGSNQFFDRDIQWNFEKEFIIINLAKTEFASFVWFWNLFS
jgi:hypothetical protein